jgi:hypothetical protein
MDKRGGRAGVEKGECVVRRSGWSGDKLQDKSLHEELQHLMQSNPALPPLDKKTAQPTHAHEGVGSLQAEQPARPRGVLDWDSGQP